MPHAQRVRQSTKSRRVCLALVNSKRTCSFAIKAWCSFVEVALGSCDRLAQYNFLKLMLKGVKWVAKFVCSTLPLYLVDYIKSKSQCIGIWSSLHQFSYQVHGGRLCFFILYKDTRFKLSTSETFCPLNNLLRYQVYWHWWCVLILYKFTRYSQPIWEPVCYFTVELFSPGGLLMDFLGFIGTRNQIRNLQEFRLLVLCWITTDQQHAGGGRLVTDILLMCKKMRLTKNK